MPWELNMKGVFQHITIRVKRWKKCDVELGEVEVETRIMKIQELN